MKKFIINIVVVLLPVLGVVAFINYRGDAANLFSSDYEKTIATELLKGKNVTNIYNLDARLLQKYIISNRTDCPKTLIIGSSRTYLIGGNLLPNKPVFNSSVSGATIEDLLALFELYEQNKCIPKNLIIGVDPWIFNVNNNQERWKSLAPEYNDFNQKIGFEKVNTSITFHKFTQIFSPSYFQSSLDMMLKKERSIIVTDKAENTDFTRLTNGTISYDYQYRSATKEEVRQRALEYIKGDIYGLENFNELSPILIRKFDAFISYLQQKDISVTFYILPYHPEVYTFIRDKKKYSMVLSTEKHLKKIAKEHSIKVLGSFNPYSLNMNNSFFYDGMHLNEKGISFLLTNKQ